MRPLVYMSRPQTPPHAYHTRAHLLSVLAALCWLISLIGCDQLSQNDAKRPAPPAPQSVPTNYQRFVPIAPPTGGPVPTIVPWHGSFTLDTKTGMLCRTVDREFPKDEWATRLPLCTAPANNGSSTKKLTPEQEKMLDEAFGPPPKTAEEFIKKHGGEAKTKPNPNK